MEHKCLCQPRFWVTSAESPVLAECYLMTHLAVGTTLPRPGSSNYLTSFGIRMCKDPLGASWKGGGLPKGGAPT